MRGADGEMSEARLFLGIDGGASRCRARLRGIDGKLLGEGVSGPANISFDVETARGSIVEAVGEALRAAGLPQEDIAQCYAGIGLAGAGSRGNRDRLLEGWCPFAKIRLVSDAHIAWLGAHGGGDGAVVILGTGSVCYGRLGTETVVLGGWGYPVSDEGSAAAIGQDLLRRSIWAIDGRIQRAPVAENVMEMLGGTPATIAAVARDATSVDFASYAALVFQFAAQDDTLAVDILTDAATHVERMIERLAALGFGRIALVGGIADSMIPWLPVTTRSRLCSALSDAREGAIMLARKQIDG